MKEKIAFVCQRYGLEVNGGAEQHCRLLAEQMTRYYDVEVYTTCALDYLTWKNHYPAGTEVINDVTVHRFPSDAVRKPQRFNSVFGKILGNPAHTDKEEESFLKEQGPLCPKALDALKKNSGKYKAIIFMTYLYYLTAKGSLMGLKNTFLIPTVHDEPPAYLRCYEPVFQNQQGIIWNTPAERAFAQWRFPGIKDKPGVIAGLGIELPAGELPDLPEQLQGVDYITYAGRIDISKGCEEMFEYFRKYKKQYGGQLKLVLMGKPVMEIPRDPDIIQLGFVSDEMKFAVMKNAKALVLFSKFESLSMVVLESMLVGRPVLVSGHCEVLKSHCIHSNAGLYFNNYPEFSGTLNYLLNHEAEYNVMCKNGTAYVLENYQWDGILKRICGLLESLAQ